MSISLSGADFRLFKPDMKNITGHELTVIFSLEPSDINCKVQYHNDNMHEAKPAESSLCDFSFAYSTIANATNNGAHGRSIPSYSLHLQKLLYSFSPP